MFLPCDPLSSISTRLRAETWEIRASGSTAAGFRESGSHVASPAGLLGQTTKVWSGQPAGSPHHAQVQQAPSGQSELLICQVVTRIREKGLGAAGG